MIVTMVNMPVDQLMALLEAAVEKGIVTGSRKAAGSVERVSAARAATMAKKRRGVVLAACESGSLPAKRSGNRWSIAVRDLDVWCSAGFPESPSRRSTSR